MPCFPNKDLPKKERWRHRGLRVHLRRPARACSRAGEFYRHHECTPVAEQEEIVTILNASYCHRNAVLMTQGQTPPTDVGSIHLRVILRPDRVGTSLSRRYWSIKWDFMTSFCSSTTGLLYLLSPTCNFFHQDHITY